MLHILVIEDSLDDFELYERALKKSLECAISQVTTAEEALKKVSEESFDIILLDYSLPTMSGLDFLKAYTHAEVHPSIPVIALTGQGSEKIAVEFMHLGVSNYISKKQD